MKKLRIYLIALFISAFSYYTQSQEKSLLWEIEGPDVFTSYVYGLPVGSYHIFPIGIANIPDKVKNAWQACEQMVIETDMAMQAQSKGLHRMKDSVRLRDLLSKSDLEKVLNTFEYMGMKESQIEDWKPVLISSILYQVYINGNYTSYDILLSDLADEKSLGGIGLESAEEQMEYYDRISYKSQAKNLLEMTNAHKRMNDLYADMIQAYLQEDIKLLSSWLDVDIVRNGTELTRRHSGWVKKFQEYMSEKPTLFTIGAEHLGTESGVLKLLKEAGFKVTPISN